MVETGTPHASAGEHVVVRVELADRPGALGAVASRIGAVGADVIGIDIVDRHDGLAIDDLLVLLPHHVPIDLLRREVGEVDQVRVRHVHPAPAAHRDVVIGLLGLVSDIAASDDGSVRRLLVTGIRAELAADWACVVDGSSRSVSAHDGSIPDDAWPTPDEAVQQSDDQVVSADVGPDLLLAGRQVSPFRPREREIVRLLGAIAGARLHIGR